MRGYVPLGNLNPRIQQFTVQVAAMEPASLPEERSRAPTPERSAAAVNVKLCEKGTVWEFTKNKSKGSFTPAMAEDGEHIGVLAYGFRNPLCRRHPG